MGVGSLLAALGYWSVAALIVSVFESRESETKRYFSDDRRITEMQSLYLLVESKRPADLGLIELDPAGFGSLKSLTPWKVPRDLIPATFKKSQSWDDQPYANFGDILAHYDASEKLIAVEFYGSRSGCFVHRDPAMPVPRNFKSQIPIKTSPPCVTAWAQDD